MDDVDCLTRLGRWAFCVSEQLQQSNASLQLETALLVDCTDYSNLLRVIFLDENVDLEIFVILRITGCNLFRQLTFGPAYRLNLAFDERHSDHATTFD